MEMACVYIIHLSQPGGVAELEGVKVAS